MICSRCGNRNQDGSNYCVACGHSLFAGNAPAGGQPTEAFKISPTGAFLKTGELLAGRYRIIAEIGRGGMGRVYRARDLELDVEVAIKVIRPEFLDDPIMVSRFKKEILLAREVSHDNVVRIHDFSEWQGLKFITMEYVEGTTLLEMLEEQGALPLETALDYAVQVCRGLEAAHRKGIVHRDLKPQNILVDRENRARIVDFGLARSGDNPDSRQTGTLIGTPRFIAPEQWQGLPGDARSDIYSLGVMLFEMVTGRPLFVAESELAYLQLHLNSQPAFNAREKRCLPAFLRRAVLRCLAKEPDARYQSAAELESDLLNRQSTGAPLRFRARRLLRRSLVTVLTLLVIVPGALFLKDRLARVTPAGGRLEHRILILPFSNNTGEERFAFWSNALADLLANALGQSGYIQVTPQARVRELLSGFPEGEQQGFPDAEKLAALFEASGAVFVLAGEFSRAGDRFRLGARVLQRGAQTAGSFSTDGLGEESIFGQIDNLADKTRLAMKLPPEVILQDYHKDIRQITTASLDALKAYSAARELFYLNRRGDSLVEYERAVSLDPHFALAYAYGAGLMVDLNDPRAEGWFDRALAAIDRVSRREAFLVRGEYYNLIRGNLAEARRQYAEMLQEYPEDEEAILKAAVTSRNMEDLDEAARLFRKLEQLAPGRTMVLANIFYLDFLRGRLSEALEFLERKKGEFERIGIYHRSRFFIFFEQGRLDLAAEELEAALQAGEDPGALADLRGDLHLLQDEFGPAEESFRLLLSIRGRDDRRRSGLMRLVNLHLHRGRLRSALAETGSILPGAGNGEEPSARRAGDFQRLLVCLQASRPELLPGAVELARLCLDELKEDKHLGERLRFLYLLGRLLIERRELGELPELLVELENLAAGRGPAFARYPLHLRAEAARVRGDFIQAKNYYLRALKLFPDQRNPRDLAGDFLLCLPRIETGLGNLAEAAALFESIVKKNRVRTRAAGAYVRANAELAVLYRWQGLGDRAREAAGRVLKWWADGDLAPEILAEMKEIAAEGAVD